MHFNSILRSFVEIDLAFSFLRSVSCTASSKSISSARLLCLLTISKGQQANKALATVTNQNERRRRSSGGELVTDGELDRYIEDEEE